MKQVLDKLEALEEVVQQLVIVVTDMKKQDPIKPKITLPNYKQEFEELKAKIDNSNSLDVSNRLDSLSTQIEKIKPPKLEFKTFRFLLFPETNQGQYYKIVFGRLIPWGILFCLLTFSFALGRKYFEVQNTRAYNTQANHYIRAWQYLDSCSNSKTERRKLEIAWKKANRYYRK